MGIDVSVVIPTFRRPGLLGEAVRSALAQSAVVDLEVIVVDDSAEGSARSEIESLANATVKWVQMRPPSGGRPSLVRNAGWQLAHGRYLHFLDDDDRVAAGAYASLTGALDANPDAGLAYGRVEPFGEDAEYLRHNERLFAKSAQGARLAQRLRSRALLVASLLFGPVVLGTSACLIRRSCVEELGGFDGSINPFEEADFFVRAVRRFGAVFIDRVAMHYRTGHASLMRQLRGGEGAHSYRQIYRKYEAEHGRLELLALKLLARGVLRWV